MRGAAGRVFWMVRKELWQLFRDPRLARIVMIAPLLQLLLFGYAVSTDVRETPTIVLDEDRTVESRELVAALTAAGIEIAPLTLHVGIGTFKPVTAELVHEHVMEAERYVIPPATAAAIAAARKRGGRVVAVGTTVVRTLESVAAANDGEIVPGSGRTRLFITPGFRFRVVDLLLTNFHLPRSTLLLLVSAFAGRERVLAAYREAIATGYRFYSYGDAMLAWPAASR